MANDFRVVIKSNRFGELRDKFPDEVDSRIRELGLEGERIVKTSMLTSPAGPTGRSLPGNPPRPDIGNLINSVGMRPIEQFVYGVYVGMDYARDLEYGTAKVAARPFMAPMAVEVQRMVDEQFDDILEMLL